MADQTPERLKVPELTSSAILLTLYREVELSARWRWRWRCSPNTLAQLRQLPPLAPGQGSIVYQPPIPATLQDPEESGWWMFGRPIRLDPDADGLALEDAATADDHTATTTKLRDTFGQAL